MDPRRHQHQLCFSSSFLTTLISYHTFSRNARGFRNFFKKIFQKTFWEGTQAAPGLFCEMGALFILFMLFVNFKFFLRRAYPFGAPARPKRVKGKLRIFKKQKRDNKRLPAKKQCLRPAKCPAGAACKKGEAPLHENVQRGFEGILLYGMVLQGLVNVTIRNRPCGRSGRIRVRHP